MRIHTITRSRLFPLILRRRRRKDRTTCEDECADRTGRGSRTESCHLQGPSDGNCTIERRDAGVCVPTAYIYVYAQIDIYNFYNTMPIYIYGYKYIRTNIPIPYQNSIMNILQKQIFNFLKYPIVQSST